MTGPPAFDYTSVARAWLLLVVVSAHTGRFACAQDDPAAYEFVEPAEPLPETPWHTHFVDSEGTDSDTLTPSVRRRYAQLP